MPFFLCFHRCSCFYCYFLSANSALGKEAARKRAAKESDIIFAAQFAAHSRKAEYRPAAIPLPQYPCRKANTAKSTAKAGLFSQTEQGKALRMLFHFSLLLITSKAAKAFSAKR